MPSLCSKALRLYPFLFAILLLGVAIAVDFQQFHNDFWDTYFSSRHLSLGDRLSWFSPQYPIGQTLFLRLLMVGGLPVVPAIVTNIIFTMLMLFVCGWLYLKFLPPAWALVSVVAMSFFPALFRYSSVAGGDPGALFLFTLGAALLLLRLSAKDAMPSFQWFLPGLFLGWAGLLRYHSLVGGGILLIALLVVYPRRWRMLALAGLGLCVGYCPQWITNLASGHGLMETQFGPMNVYYLMYGINWYHVTDLVLPSSLQIIAGDPVLFLKKYLLSYVSFYPGYLPSLVALALERDPVRKKIVRAIALWAVIYFLLFSSTSSGRQILLPLPFSFLSFGLILRALWDRLPSSPFPAYLQPRGVAVVFGLALVAASFFRANSQMLRDRAALAKSNISIEAYLVNRHVTRSTQVFTSSYDLYFRSMPDPMPYFNGGAPRWGTYLYNELLPEFPLEPEAFATACKERDVRFVVLHAEGMQLSPSFAELYEGRYAMPGLALDTAVGEFRVYRVL